jgi:hypothetical protein
MRSGRDLLRRTVTSTDFQVTASPLTHSRCSKTANFRAVAITARFLPFFPPLLMEQLDYNLLFRWFVGLNMNDSIWDVTVFTKNRERLLDGDIAEGFFQGSRTRNRAAI